MRMISKHKKFSCLSIFLGIIAILIGGYLINGMRSISSAYDKVNQDVSYIQTQYASHSYEGLVIGIQKLGPDLDNLHTQLHSVSLLNLLPFTSKYYQDADNMISGFQSIATGANNIAQHSAQVANALGFGDSTDSFLNALPALIPTIDNAMTDFTYAQNSFALVDPHYIPKETFLGKDLKTSYNSFNDSFQSVIAFLPKLDSLTPILERSFSNRSYLLLIQDETTLLPTGGKINGYGYLDFVQGKLNPIKINAISGLNQMLLSTTSPSVTLQAYVKTANLGIDRANQSPDFVTSAQQFEKLYYSIPSIEHTSGIVTIDHSFISRVIQTIGPVSLPSSHIQVTDLNLSQYISNPIFLESLGNQLFNTQGDSLVSVMKMLQSAFMQKDIILYADDQQTEDTVNQYGLGGAFPLNTGSDFIGLSEENLGGQKDITDISRSLNSQLNGLEHTLTITYVNNYDKDPAKNGKYEAWVRIYLPSGSRVESILGADGTLRAYREMGYSVADDHISVPSTDSVSSTPSQLQLVIKYSLPSNFSTDGYSMYIYKQPGTSSLGVSVSFNGKTQKDSLLSDKTFSF